MSARPPCQDCGESPRYKNSSRCLPCLLKYRKARRENDAELKAQQDAWYAEYRATDAYKESQAKRHRERQANDPEYREKRKKGYHRRKDELWQQVLEAYGRMCSCPGCNETIEEFLTIDHTNRDGHLSKGGPRSGEKLWRWLRDNDFPQEGFRLLCYNCNCGRERNDGVCPHEELRLSDVA